MQAAVERVIRSLSLKQPMHDGSSMMRDSDNQVATQLAAQLLENYRDRLAQRGGRPDNAQQG
jgi:hypothetical protein